MSERLIVGGGGGSQGAAAGKIGVRTWNLKVRLSCCSRLVPRLLLMWTLGGG